VAEAAIYGSASLKSKQIYILKLSTKIFCENKTTFFQIFSVHSTTSIVGDLLEKVNQNKTRGVTLFEDFSPL
jgi:hypothetical protein